MSWSPSSLRRRLLLWYSSILVVVLATFVAVLAYLFWRSVLGDVDRELVARAAAVVDGIRPLASGGFEFDRPEEFRAADRLGEDGPFSYGIWNATGDSVDAYPAGLSTGPALADGFQTRDGRRELWRTAANGARVVVGRDVRAVRASVWAFAGTASAAGMCALMLSLVGGWLLVGRALGPIARISRTATAMTAGDLSARIAVDRTDTELEQLAAALNSAFDRVCGVMARQQQFAADASHELRTPLATVATETEWALEAPRGAADYVAALQSCQRATARMTLVVDRLLATARGGDVPDAEYRRGDVDLDQVVGDVVHFMQPVAEKRGIALSARLDAARVRGDQDRLTDAVINLVANAVEYTGDGGAVTVDLASNEQAVRLLVRDTGVGIPREDLPFVFERFYRVDKARTGAGTGIGLGLSIAKDVVEAHGGRIACESSIGQGTAFTIILPAEA